MSKLNSFNEWDPLKEIIVGNAKNYISHDRDLSFDIFFHENLFRSDWAYPRLGNSKTSQNLNRNWSINHRYVDELNEDVENLAETLEGLGVKVLRPMELPFNAQPIRGFDWEAAPVPPLNIRDNTLILGDEIIETPPAIRSRYLETRLLSKVFNQYFESGARWTTMPRPVLTNCSFDLSYTRSTESTLGGPTEPIEDPTPSPYDIGYEMILDGAQVLRIGKDLVVNIANENHKLAVDWLERHVKDRFRLHRVYKMSDNHIDSMLLALRPGVFLARHSGLKDLMPSQFQNWKYIVPPPPEPGAFPVYNENDLVLTSPYIDLNVLSISPDTLLANKDCTGLIKTLEQEGFNVIPVQHRHRRLFGGGFHCFTLDTIREGSLEDYCK